MQSEDARSLTHPEIEVQGDGGGVTSHTCHTTPATSHCTHMLHNTPVHADSSLPHSPPPPRIHPSAQPRSSPRTPPPPPLTLSSVPISPVTSCSVPTHTRIHTIRCVQIRPLMCDTNLPRAFSWLETRTCGRMLRSSRIEPGLQRTTWHDMETHSDQVHNSELRGME